ncbi:MULTISPECIES: ComEC/Rec2 family competence protein [unclassified Rhizobium]|uniref:ComEC/Rec2 family competence protein n=1 Tax=unclassified Rhizobium TaxID=2613769 RepID=UPI001ADB9F19|nr:MULTISPECIES: ComEC/Rec2 family competence protein [unclassified Rhizobium]MBO9098310.1 ComEC/Rec2 family competence protein [Rhizobium sp. L58/93]MBO9184505.1 ComEC/Rec2 family competence protein [Rhizobium sp. E27B/91]QXZ84712.1 ComEC/Rec2 family competence protein [Rhizobium sp. K1/93]QXZ91149.1 ComEC/Rec2 family competence protein [Rhizobium sp. K15/93]QYA00362.1 ComEC/Rec2 family competence protein [Rhizobium sp. B21/90]
MAELDARERQGHRQVFLGLAERSRATVNAVAKLGRMPARTQHAVPWPKRAALSLNGWRIATAGMIAEEAAHGRAMLFAPVYIGCGAIIWFELPGNPPVTGIAAVFLVLAAVCLLKHNLSPTLRHLAFAAALGLLGMLLAEWETWRASTIMLDSPVTTTITGQVQRREVDDKGRWRYVLDLLATDAPVVRRPPEQISLLVRGQDVPFELGDVVEGRARLSPPAGPALPGLHDFAFTAYFEGTGANGFFYGTPQLMMASVDDTSERTTLQRTDRWLTGLRGHIGDRIRSILPGDTGAFAASLVNDERRAISPETTDALRVSGLAHIIAISGLNMALSAGIFYVGLRHALSLFPGLAQAFPTKKIAAIGALITVTAYYFISGFGVSAERAFIMMAIMLVAVLFDRPSFSLRNVALSAIAILVLSPSQILGPSFQMSYAATIALVSGYSLWKRRPPRERRFAAFRAPMPVLAVSRFFTGIAMTSFIGGASTAIFSIEHFHRLATYGLVANLAAMPVVSFIVMPVGMLAMLMMPFGLDGVFWLVTGWGLDIVMVIAKTVAAWGGNVPFARLPSGLFPTIIAGFMLMTVLRTPMRHAGALLIAASVTFAAFQPSLQKSELLISEDGELVAMFRQGRLERNRERPPDFIYQQWQRALPVSEDTPPQMLPPDNSTPPHSVRGRPSTRMDAEHQATLRSAMETALDNAVDGGFACHGRDWCVAMLETGAMLVTISDAAYLGPACDTADIVITPVKLRLDLCRSGAVLYTGASLRKTGSIEVNLISPEPKFITAFSALDRPWERHRAYDWRKPAFTGTDATSPVSDTGG